MSFNSLSFLIFFPVVAAVYFALPHRRRWMWLLFASCVFYMAWIPAYISVLLVLILVDYAAGLGLEALQGRRRKTVLLLSLGANLSILGFFKYFDFLTGIVAEALRWGGVSPAFPSFPFLLPLGLSFHTFQSMAYTLEVYRGTQKAERHLGFYALYVLFWPQLVAGPIERPQHLLPQLRRPRLFSADRAFAGLRLMLWGFLKKIVIADQLARVVDFAFHSPETMSSPSLWVAVYFFAVQIYCDFSGYTDIARGAATVLGIDLAVNFRSPYAARSPAEFWSRWHISLSTWFRDYVYIPLSISPTYRRYDLLNILIVFTLSGLWHGARWTFVVWGLYHGVCYALGTVARREPPPESSSLKDAARDVVGWVVTFHCVVGGWIFFRSQTLSDACYVLLTLGRVFDPLQRHMTLGLRAGELAWMGALAGAVVFGHLSSRWVSWETWFMRQPAWRRWSAYYAGFVLLVAFTKFENYEFIYFQF